MIFFVFFKKILKTSSIYFLDTLENEYLFIIEKIISRIFFNLISQSKDRYFKINNCRKKVYYYNKFFILGNVNII